MFGPQAFFMNKQLKINKGFFTAIISAFSDLDASIDQQFELRNKESQLLPASVFYLFNVAIVTINRNH